MPCYKPVKGFLKSGGGLTFNRNLSKTSVKVTVPCGNCIGCRIQRTKEWAIRCMHESALHEANSFITLTYSPEHIPHDLGLKKADFQNFMKRLRKQVHPKKIRYYMCGEYGDDDGALGRPHYHAIIFGHDFPDKTLWEEKNGNRYYRSKSLEKLWPLGLSNITDVNFQTAAYVARYVMKKINGEQAENHYVKLNKETGELHEVIPEYNAMSLKPGIAHDWFEKYKTDVFPHDYVVIDGHKAKTPKYYLDRLKVKDETQHLEVKQKRRKYAQKNSEHNTDERLNTREQVAHINLNRMKRNLK